jgi:preprotein translocase subunit SecG
LFYLLLTLYIISCFVLILFVLLQPGKSDQAQIFGGGANSTAFGPRGTQTVLAKITIGAAIIFFLSAFLFSIPGLFDQRSIGETVPAESAPTPPVTPPVPAPTDQSAQPAVTPPAQTTQPAPAAPKPTQQGGAKKPEPKKDSKKP